MDFFGAQDQARGRTARLLWYYALAVLLIVVAVYFAVTAGFFIYEYGLTEYGLFQDAAAPTPIFSAERLLVTSACTLGAILLASTIKHAQLRAGGAAVCESLGGRRVDTGTTDPEEKKFVNVAQEMSIASGIPMPRLYVLDQESSINAFAAGLSPNDAAIAVTRGTLGELSRDELQGVVAHEYSHILNGDMRMNLRLVAALHGILALTLLARGLRHMSFSGRGSRSSSSEGKGAGALVVAVVVVIILVTLIGAIGSLFARIIQAAVSRERELLADASAVQFTRNPEAVAGALRRIGGHGSVVNAGNALEFAHSFFATMEGSWFSRVFATHPPLATRIRAIDPRWNGEMQTARTFHSTEPSNERRARAAAAGARLPDTTSVASIAHERHSASLLGLAGVLGAPQLDYARTLVAATPPAVLDALSRPAGAEALLYVLLLHEDVAQRERQWAKIAPSLGDDVQTAMRTLSSAMKQVSERSRLPLVELGLPALSGLDPASLVRLERNIDAMILVDDRVGLFEFLVRRLVHDRLRADVTHRAADPLGQRRPDARRLRDAEKEVLSVVVATEEADPKRASEIVRGCSAAAGYAPPLLFVGRREHFAHLDAALDTLKSASFAQRRRLLDACERAIAHDGEVSTTEAELFRAISGALDVPIAPLVR